MVNVIKSSQMEAQVIYSKSISELNIMTISIFSRLISINFSSIFEILDTNSNPKANIPSEIKYYKSYSKSRKAIEF
jgi:hypothetical protein